MRKLIGITVAVVALAGIPAALAQLQQENQAPSTREVFPVPATALDRSVSTTLTAVVRSDGRLARGVGVSSTGRLSPAGQYEVIFNRDVKRCTYVATLGDVGSTNVPLPGFIVVAGRDGRNRGVFIQTYNLNGNRQNRSFQLAVHCP